MIPDFKTYIGESVWADIHKRSSGVQARKEDDVNLLDLIDFYNYIKEQYKSKVEYVDLEAMGTGNVDVLSVDITENIILFYKPKRGHILLSWSEVKIPMPFFDELTEMFKVENPNVWRRIITEKDGSCTNKTFIDVIEFFLEHKDCLVNESVWADIHRRSNGKQERKEDMLNDSWGIDEMYDYIDNHYKYISDESIKDNVLKSTWSLTVPIFQYYDETIYLSLKPYETYKFIVCPDCVRAIKPFFEELCKKYKVKSITNSNNSWYEICPKGLEYNSITNTFFIELIDYFLDFDGTRINKFKKIIEKK